MELTPEQWARITPLCRQVVKCTAEDYGYIHDNSLKIEDIMCDNAPSRFTDGSSRIFDKEERSRLWRSAIDKDCSVAEMVTFMNTFNEVKQATIARIEKELGRSIRDL